MLLDFTNKLPFISSDACGSSIVVRIRAVEKNDFAVWHMAGDQRKQGDVTLMYAFTPANSYQEGNDQVIHDFLIRPTGINWAPNEVHSFRVLSAIPAVDHPWKITERWLVLNLGDRAKGIAPQLRLGDLAVFELSGYRPDSAILPDPPFKIPEAPAGQTFWSRLLLDD